MQDVWNALRAIVAADYGGAAFETWTGHDWVTSDSPQGVPIIASDVRDAHSWYYIRNEKRSRHYYLGRVRLPEADVHVLEIERRVCEGVFTEQMCGAGFADRDPILALELCHYAREHEGVFTDVPFDVVPLRHRRDKDGTLEAALRTLFRRLVGVFAGL